jgi:hypothetical protein
MAGALYIWIMLAFFIGCVGVMALIVGVLAIGHWIHKKETGDKTAFLEVPEAARGRPASTANLPAVDAGLNTKG